MKELEAPPPRKKTSLLVPSSHDGQWCDFAVATGRVIQSHSHCNFLL